jgi:hypothetical protein
VTYKRDTNHFLMIHKRFF